MSRAERDRTTLTVSVEDQSVSQVRPAGLPTSGERQARRIRRRDKDGGYAGLMHRWRGKPGLRGKPATLGAQVLERCTPERHADFGPTLPARGLAKESLVVDHDTSHCLTAGAGPPIADARRPRSSRPSMGLASQGPRIPSKTRHSRVARHVAAILAVVCLSCAAPAKATVTNFLAYTPSPLDNPLTGLMPPCSPAGAVAGFPHSLQYASLSVASVMTGPTNFNWAQLEHWITSATNDGCQLVFRPYLDFPGMPTGIPQFLLSGGLVTYPYLVDGGGLCPNYADPNLQAAVLNFIAALGARYDNDPRIGFIEVGLLGFWGEWHCDGTVANYWAPLAFQQQVLAAYVAAFPTTKLLVRYPVGSGNTYSHRPMADNVNLPIGYHDDSFCTDTLGLPGSCFFVQGEVSAGWGGTNKWQTCPIGAQMTTSLSTSVWQTPSGAPAGQDFTSCVAATHATYMLAPGVFAPGWSTNAGYQNSLVGAAQLGYELYVTQVLNWIQNNSDGSKTLYASMFVTNTGVAPFYYNWQVELAAVDPGGNILATWFPSYQITQVVPGNGTYQMWGTLPGASTTVPFTLVARVINPLPNGRPFRFANAGQDQTLKGWLTLGTMP